MAYSDFTLADLKHRFGLAVDEQTELFRDATGLTPSALLAQTLHDNAGMAQAIGTEKAKSEFVVAPILSEVRQRMRRTIGLFSGVPLDVDPARGLNGTCDFLLTATPAQFDIEAPVVAVVEAKKDLINTGIAQCLATMFAAQAFNQSHQTALPAVYGAVTTGALWRFLRLSGTRANIDTRDYFLADIGLILGILVRVLEQAQQAVGLEVAADAALA